MIHFERRFWAAAVDELGGREYGHARVDLNNLHDRRRRKTDCVIAQAIILAALHGPADVVREWGAFMIADPSQPFSPIDVAVRLGFVERVDEPVPGGIHMFQGWRELDPRGWVPEKRADPADEGKPNGHAGFFYSSPLPVSGSSLLVNANTVRPWCDQVTYGELAGKYSAGFELAVLL